MFLRRNSATYLFLAFFIAVALSSMSHAAGAQTTPAAAPAAAPSSAQAASPEIHAVLDKMVHPKKAKVGDAVTAHMTELAKLKDGTELSKGTRLVGKVTEVKAKADKEGPSKLGLLFDKAQPKDGKEIAVTMALVSVAPHYEPGGVDAVAAENTGSSIGRTAQMSGGTAMNEPGSSGAVLNKGLGIRSAGGPTSPGAMQPGVSYLPDVTIASYSMGEPGTVLQSTKTTVYVDAGSRLLLLAQ